MIKITRLNQSELYINSELIESVEETPDTVISLTTGKKIVVEESAQDIIDRIIAFRISCQGALPRTRAHE